MPTDHVHHPAQLAELVGSLTRVETVVDPGNVPQAVCELAVRVLHADHASISTFVRGRFITVAATDQIAEDVDSLQERLREGPCLDALKDSRTHVSGDLMIEEKWPRFGRAAATELEVHSILSHRLRLETDSIGALNVSTSRPDAFWAHHEQLAVMFGAQAASTLRAAGQNARADNLVVALSNARTIGIAIGFIMRDQHVDAEEAFGRLARASQATNRKLAHIAAEVATSRTRVTEP